MRNRRKRNTYPKQANEGRSTYLVNLGQKPTWKQSRPNMQSPCERRSWGGNNWVWPHLGCPYTLHVGTASPFHVASLGGSTKVVACGILWNIPYNRPFHSYI